jgi:hypothetical protein
MAYFPTIAIGVPFFKGGGFSQEALDWQARIIANGGTIPDATLAIFDNNFFKPAKANGNILSELDRLNIYCGLNGFEIAARTNIIKSAHFVTPVSSPTFDNNGYKSSGTSYLNLNFNPRIQGVKYITNSSTHFAVVKNPPFSATIRMIGAAEGGSINQSVLVRLNTPRLDAFTNANSATQNINTFSSGNILLAGTRSILANQNAIIETNTSNSIVVSTNVPNLDIYELAINFNGAPLGGYDTSSHLCSGHGSSNLDLAALRTILNNLFTVLGI